MEKEISCGAVVINEKKEILLVKTVKGYYGFPKGHMEKGETKLETAIREVKEETNIDIEIVDSKEFLLSYEMDNGVFKDVVLFLAKPVTKEVKRQEKEISDIKWVYIDRVNSCFDFDDIRNLWNDQIKPYILDNYFRAL